MLISFTNSELILEFCTLLSVRVSNKLGMRHPRAATYSFMVTMFYSILLGMVLMIITFLSKDNLAIIFTNSKDMQLAVTDLAYLLGLTMVVNSAAQVMSGNKLLWILQKYFILLNFTCSSS